MVTQRRVAVRTVANAQQASQSLGDFADKLRVGYETQLPTTERNGTVDRWGEPTDRSGYTRDLPQQPLNLGNYADTFKSDYQPPSTYESVDVASPYEQRTDFSQIAPSLSGIYEYAGMDPQARSVQEGIRNAAFSQYEGLLDPALIDQVMNDTWLEVQRGFDLSQATAETMINLALEEAALPYDQKLRNIDRSIEDVRGKMDDLDRITDYYKSTIVDTWERAAQAGRNATGDDIRAQIAPRIAAIGSIYELENENMQAYLDRIGGVPQAQRLAIRDAISELQSPYEGLSETEGSFAARIADATGLLFEKKADWGLADANWQAEMDRFVSDAQLTDAVEQLEMDREDEVGWRARAMNIAKQKAANEYRQTNQLPDPGTFYQNAMYGAMETLGVDPIDQQAHLQTIEGFLTQGLGALGFEPPPIMINGEEVPGAWPPIRSAAELENMLRSHVPVELIDEDDVRVWMNMMYAYERQGAEYANMQQRLSTGREAGTGGRGKGSQAADNLANRDNPVYRQRAAMTDNLADTIESTFDVKVWGQWRDTVDPNNKDQDPNSDHLSGGALDVWPTTSGGKEEMDRLAASLANWPEVSFVRWQTSGHWDHLHVSFLLPPDIGSGAYASSVLPDPVRTEGPYATTLDDKTRSLLQGFLGYEGQL